MIDRLFFYGTLMSDGHPRGQLLQQYGLAEPVGPARIYGELYPVAGGAFPALVRQGGANAIVHGELWAPTGGADRSERIAALLAALRIADRIEGYYPGDDARSMYLREAVDLLDGGQAWTYVWNYGHGGLGPRIASGSWREWTRVAA